MNKVYLIAEIGCNHCGSFKIAKEMVRIAKECGVDAVKFQTFSASALISKYAPKAEYQKKTTCEDESQLDMTRRLELSHEEYVRLRDYALALGLDVFSTPFDFGSVDFLEAEGQTIWKIPSGEITNLPMLERIAKIKVEGKKIILSTGMSTIEEIHQAVDIISKYDDSKNLVLLHCNTEYPTPDKDVNLSAIDTLHEEFPNIKIGFSDHSVGYVAAIGAYMKGIILIEKHFTLDKSLPGPDHKASATPEELKALCENIRRIEVMAGEGGKIVTESERRNIVVARKSIIAKRDINKGEVLTEDNITCKRPGSGISPMRWYEVLGTIAVRDFKEDELIEL